jgi:hypothetical protein
VVPKRWKCVDAHNGDVHHVTSWEEACEIFDDPNARYSAGGHLLVIVERYELFLDEHPELESWWRAALDVAVEQVASRWPPSDLPRARREQLFDYCQTYVPKLLGEIVVGSLIDCTYFREQLQWFHAGHLPCGWEGDWPSGRMRVF